jgi:hypothetical protein
MYEKEVSNGQTQAGKTQGDFMMDCLSSGVPQGSNKFSTGIPSDAIIVPR